MSLVTVQNVSLAFMRRQVFDKIGFQVDPGDRIGLIGPNGSGKTSLLKLIMGAISPDKGDIRTSKGTRIAYLPQDVQETFSGPLLQSVLDAAPGRVHLENELKRLEQALEGALHKQEQVRLAERLTEAHQEINHLELEFPRHLAEKILIGLGFETSDFFESVSTLSGGWKMRAVLAGLLYQKPDLLLMDEPTNHLDIPSIRWLDQFLQDYKGAMVLVSHDREFLNRQITRIVSFETEGMRTYSGNYDFYLKTRKEEQKSIEAKARKQEKKIKEAQKFIERFRAKASKARQAQSKIKLVEKIDLVERHHKVKTIHFSFPEVPRSGREVVSIRDLAKGFGKGFLYEDINLTVLRGERIAIIGANGSGKTTLLRMLAGEIEADKGDIKLGHGVSMGYFAQHHSDMLDPDKTVIEEVYQVVPHETIGFVRGVCGSFLFSGEEVDKVTGVLSGGERARVSLAKLLVKPGNFMVMDEPTNHLDIESSEILINALTEYRGTMLFVSHNQSFINRLATKIWDIQGRKLLIYPGNLTEYYEHLARLEFQQAEKERGREDTPKNGKINKVRDRKAEKREKARRRQLIHDALKPILNQGEALEGQISELESRQKELEKTLADPDIFSDKNKSVPLLKEYNILRKELDALLWKWEQNQDQLESAKKKMEV
ncbi:MAG: ATP-binding cassette domain-containing protein [Desulfobacterales bacterium]|nr:ATP-binding cassette domain-containing protein [Desulfobacterales bacterium]